MTSNAHVRSRASARSQVVGDLVIRREAPPAELRDERYSCLDLDAIPAVTCKVQIGVPTDGEALAIVHKISLAGRVLHSGHDLPRPSGDPVRDVPCPATRLPTQGVSLLPRSSIVGARAGMRCALPTRKRRR